MKEQNPSRKRNRWQRRIGVIWIAAVAVAGAIIPGTLAADAKSPGQPNIVLVMSDDQGWGQTGYNGHPILKTPNLDAMVAAGMRMDRFYAGAPVCSPTRAAVLTGRMPRRTGVPEHGFALRHQEITLPQILARGGYVTGHFGKWHLDGLRGPGVPILKSDRFHPGTFGFDQWLSTTNFFDLDPILSRQGEFESFDGDSSEVVVAQAVEFLKQTTSTGTPSLTVIWFGSPHSPFISEDQDRVPFEHLDRDSANQHAELVAMDRSIGTLRRAIDELGIAENTLLWFNSDNGGLGNIRPSSVGDLRGNKGKVYEGGLRVPGILQWPSVIKPGSVCRAPACVTDILPTVLDIAKLKHPDPSRPCDGISIHDWLSDPPPARTEPLVFWYRNRAALIDNQWKLVRTIGKPKRDELYRLDGPDRERNNLRTAHRDVYQRMAAQLSRQIQEFTASERGHDYPEGKVAPDHPQPRYWDEVPEYQPHLDTFSRRSDYRNWGVRAKRPWAAGIAP